MSDVPPLPTPSYGISQIYNSTEPSSKRPNTQTNTNAPAVKKQRTSGGKVTRRNKRKRTNRKKRSNRRKGTNKNRKSRRQ